MDSNNVNYFLIREADEFANRSTRIQWDRSRRALVLAQNQELRLPASDAVAALAEWQNARPLVFDAFAQQGRIHTSNQQLEYNAGRGYLPLVDGNLQPVDAPAGDFTDLVLGGDGRLAAGYSNDSDTHGILVFHLARRWQVAVDGLPARPLRVHVDPENKVWCLTATHLICCEGEPLPHTYVPARDRFEPVSVNPHPLQIVLTTALPVADQPLALCSNDNELFILVHDGSGGQSIISRSLQPGASSLKRFTLDPDCPFAIDMQFVSVARLALLAPRQAGDSDFTQRDCAVVQPEWNSEDETGEAMLIRERYPMLSQAVARFVSSADARLRYQAEVDSESVEAEQGFEIDTRELHPLQRPRYYAAATATLTRSLDSGQPDTVWHRLYMEGCIPPGTRVIIYVKTYNNPDQRSSTRYIRQPDWVWCEHRSDQAYGRGLVDAVPGERGLFECLLQRDAGPVRRMVGRYLQLRIRLESDSRHSPAIYALKVYYPRFSYQEAYLPEHFRQEHPVDSANDDLPANGADLRERLFAAFEGVLTPLEGQLASSEILLSPENTPAAHLPWLAELMGQTVPDHWPTERRRRWIAATGLLQRWRGSLAGINLALDIITDGAVGRGQVVLVENFRLRRTMATILGLDMDDSDHPLTLGTGMSGNSIVGDSLILAEADTREFLALFSPELATNAEAEIVEEFFDRYAHQVTVLLHGQARQLKEVVEAALEEQMPAHLEWQILETDHPFVLGLSPLLAVDTFIERRPPPKRVTLDDTYLGSEGLLRNHAALSPQDVNARREA
jgi:phage tail-like protein